MTRARADYAIAAKDATKAGIDSARRNFSTLDKSVLGLKSNILDLGKSILPVLGVAGFGAMIKSGLASADAIQKLSIQTGASTEALSQYKLVASQTGVEFETLTTAWQKQSIRIAEATQGTGAARDALERLGLSANDLIRLRPEDQFEAIAEAISKIPNPAERAAIAQKLWEETGVKLLRTTEGGAEAIRKLRDEADRLGLTLSRDAVDAAAKANDEMDKLAKATEAAGIQFALLTAGPLTQFAIDVGDTISIVRQLIDEMRGFESRTTLPGLAEGIEKTTGQLIGMRGELEQLRKAAELQPGNALLQAELSQLEKGVESTEAKLKRLQKSFLDISSPLPRTAAEPPALPPSTGSDDDAKAIAKEAESLIKSLRTPHEAYAEQIERIKILHGAGLLSAQDYARAMRDAGNSLQKATGNTIDLRRSTEELVQIFADGTGRAFTMVELLEEQEQVLGGLKTAQDKYNEAMALYSLLAEQGLITDEQRIAALEKLSGELSDSAKTGIDAARDLGLTFSSAFEKAILEGGKLRDILKGLERDIAAIIARKFVTEPLAAGITAGINALPFGRGADGGRPIPFRPIVVGEKRPELFIPDSVGTLYPNVPSGGSTNYNVTYAPQITAMDAASVSRVLTSPDARKTIVSTINSAFARIGQRPGLR